MRIQFVVKPEHIKLLRQMHVSNHNSDVEFGAPEIDPKRPYGNSDVYADMAEILGITEKEYLLELHEEMPTVLQIVLRTGSFRPGTYEADKYRRDWRQVLIDVGIYRSS